MYSSTSKESSAGHFRDFIIVVVVSAAGQLFESQPSDAYHPNVRSKQLNMGQSASQSSIPECLHVADLFCENSLHATNNTSQKKFKPRFADKNIVPALLFHML